MTEQTNKKILFSILVFISLVLVSAFIIEHQLDNKPCKLCIYQRFPYIVSILLVFSIFLFKKNIKTHLLILSIISLFGSVLAFYHFGIEQGFFNESIMCEAQNLEENLSKQDILKQLKQNIVSCKDVNFTLFGLSLALINTIVSFVLFMIFIRLYKNNEIN